MRTIAINPDNVSKPASHNYSQGIVVEGARKLVFISGQIPEDSAGIIVGPGDVEAQTRQIFKNIEAVLAAAGGNLKNIVKVTTYLADMKHFEKFDRVRSEFLSSVSPASTLVAVNPETWTRFSSEILVEIDAIAALS